MRRIRSVVAVAATVAAMTMAFSVPAMADVDFDGDKREDRHDKYEDRIDEYYDELEDAYDEDGFFYYAPLTLYYVDDIEDIEDVLDLD